MSDAAFGHTGFTGTSLWIDPEQDVFALVLTNAVLAPHAYDPMAVLADVRADIADLAVCAVSDRTPLSRLRAEIGINWFHPGAAPVSLSGN
jgi:CubicO group peptidase (beta-lactamase class C family)